MKYINQRFIFDPSLVLYLPLYQADGSSIMSRDAYGHPCTVTGALWRPDGHYLDGTDDKITFGNSTALQISTEQTVEAWVWPDETPDWCGIFSKSDQGVTITGWELYLRSLANGFSYRTGNGVSYDTATGNDGAPLKSKTWYHVVGISTGISTKIFVNGLTRQSRPNNYLSADTANNGKIGERSGKWWKGMIGEVRIYSKCLTLPEIQHNYLATKWRYR